MPWYIVNGNRVHLKFSGKSARNPPAPCCARVERDGRAARCCDISTILCDWPLEAGGTCDAPLCTAHGAEVGRDRHYCPKHAAIAREREPELL